MGGVEPVIDRDTVRRFCEVGRDLFVTGAVSSHGGNLSERRGERIVITRRGSMLGRLGSGDVVWTELAACERDAECSREIVVHRAIYEATEARAIVHAHTLHTVWRSMISDVIEPIDSEGRYVLGTVPVVEATTTIASPEAAALLAEALRAHPVAVLRTHGPFARGETLEEAFYHVSSLEASCALLDLRDASGRDGERTRA
ncbi:MAG TPA: class II aldolase/adducin family protein [Coriobacteriia bacterium]|nr:class II aldolase/adducin family protein [Coriobacteriia bacterium]